MAENHWPADFRTAAEAAFDGSLNAGTFHSVSLRVDHAFKVWRNRYAMTPEQEEYAWKLLSWAVVRASASAHRQIDAGAVRKPYIYLRRAVVASMENVVNDPAGHEGFKRRAGLVDVTAILAEVAA